MQMQYVQSRFAQDNSLIVSRIRRISNQGGGVERWKSRPKWFAVTIKVRRHATRRFNLVHPRALRKIRRRGCQRARRRWRSCHPSSQKTGGVWEESKMKHLVDRLLIRPHHVRLARDVIQSSSFSRTAPGFRITHRRSQILSKNQNKHLKLRR